MNIENAYYGANLFYMTVIVFAVLFTAVYFTVKAVATAVLKQIVKWILKTQREKAQN